MKKHIKFSEFIISLLVGMLPVFPSPVLSCDNEVPPPTLPPIDLPTDLLPFEFTNKLLDDLIDSLKKSIDILKDIDNRVQNVGISLNQYPHIVDKVFDAQRISKFIHDSLDGMLKEFGVVLKSNSQWPYSNNANFIMCDISTSVESLKKLLNNLIFQLESARQNLNVFDHYRHMVENNTFNEKILIDDLSYCDEKAKIICDKLTDIIKKYNLKEYSKLKNLF